MPITFAALDTSTAHAGDAGIPMSEARARFVLAPVAGDDAVARRHGFEAGCGEVMRATDTAGHLVVTVGLGEAPDPRAVRRAAAALGRAIRHCERITVEVPDFTGFEGAAHDLSEESFTRAIVEGVALGTYEFLAHKSDPKPNRLAAVDLVGADPDAIARGIDVGVALAGATALARDLANETPARMTARRLADVAVSLAADHDLAVEIWDEDRIEAERLGCLLAVNAGSAEPARVIRLEHRPFAAGAHIALVGKGITFDSGGLSLKRPEGMYEMKGDMGGAAAVLGAMRALADLQVAVRVTAIVMATDNLPGTHATKPGEIVAARNGTTVEILDTDAEGRLVLADGLCLAAELEPDAIIDVATLTGYARVLGTHFTPLMCTDDDLADDLIRAAARAGERVWRLPLPDEFEKALESPIADLRNIPDPDDAGTVAPGVFLRHFAGSTRYAHLDIGETGFSSKDDGDLTKGCTGTMTRTLVEYLLGVAAG